MFESLWQALSSVPSYFIDPNKRIFWGYLAAAVLLCIPVYIARDKSRSWRGFFAFLFPKKVWLAKSARQDYQLWIINKLIKALLFTPIILTMVPVALATTDALEWAFGTFTPLVLSPVAVVAIFTLALFIADDFTRFILHYALHKIPFLWEFHKVHHSAKVLTPFTIYRSHPIESYLYACRMALMQGVVVGAGYYFFGARLSMFDILGANVFVFLFNVFGANLRHSHIWLSWGKTVEGYFISPAQHQIHHSDNPAHFDRNLGSALAIWDRLFGTLTKAHQVKNITIGVGQYDAKHDSLWAIYTKPIIESVKRLGIQQRK